MEMIKPIPTLGGSEELVSHPRAVSDVKLQSRLWVFLNTGLLYCDGKPLQWSWFLLK